MVVLARPREQGGGDVTLEEDDVIEYVLEKPFGEVLGCTLDSSSLQRSLSARVRRRERVRHHSTPHLVHRKSLITVILLVSRRFLISYSRSDLNFKYWDLICVPLRTTRGGLWTTGGPRDHSLRNTLLNEEICDSRMTRCRHQERSPEQFGAMFRTLPAMTPGYLHPPVPVPVPSHSTLPRRSEPTHRKLPNGLEPHGSAAPSLQGN